MVAARSRYSVWSIVAPVALLGILALTSMLVIDALRAPAPVDRGALIVTGSTAQPTDSASDQSIPSTYRIRNGDTLSTIAERYRIRVETIRQLNPSLNPLALAPGDTITLRAP